MAAPTVEPKLSFDRHLRHAFSPLSSRMEKGIRSLDRVIEMLRLRIEAEAEFARSLEKIIINNNLMSSSDDIGSLQDGLDSVKADIKNEYHQRIEYLNSLNEDVYQPCIQMRELYASKNRTFANETKRNIKTLRQQQKEFYKCKSKFEKVCKDASAARAGLINAKSDNKISSAQILKLGTKVNTTMKTQQQWQQKFDSQKLIWNKHQVAFDDNMTAILQGMESNEQLRMRTTCDSLNKWAVFITNLCANRNYDVKTLAESMSLIEVDNDMQAFMKNTLRKYPSKNHAHSSFSFHLDHKESSHIISSLSKASHARDSNRSANGSLNNNNNSITNKNSKIMNSHNRGGSLSLSSFTNTSQRKMSASYSFSDKGLMQSDLMSANPNVHHNSTKSIGSFFSNKFGKHKRRNSRNKNSYQSRTNGHNGHHREESNTISSYRDSELYDEDQIVYPEPDPNTPRSPALPMMMFKTQSADTGNLKKQASLNVKLTEVKAMDDSAIKNTNVNSNFPSGSTASAPSTPRRRFSYRERKGTGHDDQSSQQTAIHRNENGIESEKEKNYSSKTKEVAQTSDSNNYYSNYTEKQPQNTATANNKRKTKYIVVHRKQRSVSGSNQSLQSNQSNQSNNSGSINSSQSQHSSSIGSQLQRSLVITAPSNQCQSNDQSQTEQSETPKKIRHSGTELRSNQ